MEISTALEILNLSKDTNKKEIKKAYAKLLKIHNPEDDAEGYQRIREAYDVALKYLKDESNVKVETYENIIDNTFNYEEEEINRDKVFPKDIFADNIEEYEEENNINLIYELMDKFQNIYDNLELRNDIKEWKKAMKSYDELWDISNNYSVETYLFEFLINHKDCPKEVYELFNMYSGWTTSEMDLYNKYDESQIRYVLYRIKSYNLLGDDYVDEIPKDRLLEYLRLREEIVFDFYCDYNGNAALAKIYDVLAIYPNEHYMLNIKAKYLINRNGLKEAKEVLKQSISINNSNENEAKSILKELKKEKRSIFQGGPKSYFALYFAYRLFIIILKHVLN